MELIGRRRRAREANGPCAVKRGDARVAAHVTEPEIEKFQG
jgi:hypothetical protein